MPSSCVGSAPLQSETRAASSDCLLFSLTGMAAATQTIMMNQPEVLHAFLEHLTEALIVYLSYQIDSGAQVGHIALPSTP